MIRFEPKDYPDIDTMNQEQLKAYLVEVEQQIEALDAREPADMESEAYEVWGDAHEMLEDLLDDILDRLEDLK